ncbi:MAG: hypothetical protein FJ308_06480 [Planctomycetes bacterium]|nr:hypothetical protein [Planctomycetota bacterium]
MQLSVIDELDYLRLGICEVKGLNRFTASQEFDSWVDDQLAVARAEVLTPQWQSRREAVRGLLRRGGFKPSGRSKPAQEYLLRCLNDGNFPRINPAVDCLNVLSIRIGLPISMLDKSRFPDALRVRVGQPEEKYVFNSVGQELDLGGLITVCGGPGAVEPLGSPVKDSMAGKITETVSEIVCILYGPIEEIPKEWMDDWAFELKHSIERFAIQ